jgi:hypothetical protein
LSLFVVYLKERIFLIAGFNTACAEITDAGLIKDAVGLGENDEIRPFRLQSADQAAKALEPLVKSLPYAGQISKAIFALGIIITGLLAVPVLAGSAGYALADGFGWKEGLGKKFKDVRSFYLVIAIATLAGLTINFISIDPIQALVYAAVINGVVAVPNLIALMRIANDKKILQARTNGKISNLLGLTYFDNGSSSCDHVCHVANIEPQATC